MINEKPKYIVEKPIKRKVRNYFVWVIKCNNGMAYDLKTLCSVIGLNDTTLKARMKKMHWSDKRILSLPPKSKTDPKRTGSANLDHIPEGDLKSIKGNRDRSKNLEKIPSPTKYEEELWK